MSVSYYKQNQSLVSPGGANASIDLTNIPVGGIDLFWPTQVLDASEYSIAIVGGVAVLTLGFATTAGDTGYASYIVQEGTDTTVADVQTAMTEQGYTEALAADLLAGGTSPSAIAAAVVAAFGGRVPVYASPPPGYAEGFIRDQATGQPMFIVAEGETDIQIFRLPCRPGVNLTSATGVTIIVTRGGNFVIEISAEAVAPVSPSAQWSIQATSWPCALAPGIYQFRGQAVAVADGSLIAATGAVLVEVRV